MVSVQGIIERVKRDYKEIIKVRNVPRPSKEGLDNLTSALEDNPNAELTVYSKILKARRKLNDIKERW